MKLHDSQRGWFAYELYQQMKENKDIYLIVGDLGYGMFDAIKEEFPERFINVGAAEQAMMGLAVGLALHRKIPFVYSITTFLLYRPFEWVRNYIHGENIPVRLVASGRDKDYTHDGPSHWSEDAVLFMDKKRGLFYNIKDYYPETKEEVPGIVRGMIVTNGPSFISLRR